jgi:hypothetical protein
MLGDPWQVQVHGKLIPFPITLVAKPDEQSIPLGFVVDAAALLASHFPARGAVQSTSADFLFPWHFQFHGPEPETGE